nr:MULTISPECIES: GAF domain-containing protein [Mesorhizobium]
MDPAFNAADKDVLGASDNMKVSFIGVPVRVDANVVGTPTIDRILDNKSGSLLDYELRLLTTIANLVGQTVKLHRIFLAAGASIGRNDFDCCHGQCFSAAPWKSGPGNKVLQLGPMMPDRPATRPTEAAPWAAATVPSVLSDQAPLASASAASLRVRVCKIASVSSRPWRDVARCRQRRRLLRLTPRQIGYTLRKYGIRSSVLERPTEANIRDKSS